MRFDAVVPLRVITVAGHDGVHGNLVACDFVHALPIDVSILGRFIRQREHLHHLYKIWAEMPEPSTGLRGLPPRNTFVWIAAPTGKPPLAVVRWLSRFLWCFGSPLCLPLCCFSFIAISPPTRLGFLLGLGKTKSVSLTQLSGRVLLAAEDQTNEALPHHVRRAGVGE